MEEAVDADFGLDAAGALLDDCVSLVEDALVEEVEEPSEVSVVPVSAFEERETTETEPLGFMSLCMLLLHPLLFELPLSVLAPPPFLCPVIQAFDAGADILPGSDALCCI